MPLTFRNLFETVILTDDFLNIIKDLMSKEKGRVINNLTYIGEVKGPKINDYTINVLNLPQTIEIIFGNKNDDLIGRTIDKINKKIYEKIFGGVSLDKLYLFYKLE